MLQTGAILDDMKRGSLNPRLLISESDSRLVAVFRSVSAGASVSVLLVGIAVLVGWLFDLPVLKSVVPGLVTMKGNTAVAFALIGASLLLLQAPSPLLPFVARVGAAGSWMRRTAHVCAVVVALIGLFTLVEYLAGVDLGLDQVLFEEAPGAAHTIFLGRMAPNTALNFLIIGVALLALDVETRRGRRPAQYLILIEGVLAFLAMLGYAYGISTLYGGLPSLTPMALNTAVAFFAACVGVLCARPERGLMALFTSPGPGGVIARRLFLVAIAAPIALEVLAKGGEGAGVYDHAFESAFHTLLVTIVFVLALLAGARWLDRVESERRRAEEWFRKGFAGAPVGMTLAAADGRFLEVNNRLCEMLGYTAEELTSGSFAAITHPDDAAASREFVRSALAGERADGRFEKRYLRKDGSVLWAEVSSTLLRDPAGRPLHFVTHIQDITARIEAEQARAHLVAIVESSDDAIIGKTLGGVVTSWNRGATRIYGYTAGEMVGSPLSIVMPADRSDEAMAVIARIAGGGSVEHYETVRVRKDGQRIDVSLTVSPILNASGRIIGASTIARDVTAQRQAEERIRVLNAELERRLAELEIVNKELEAFSYSVSHDLRAPLRSIDGFSQALLEEYHERLDDQGRIFLTRVRANAQKMGHLIDDILKLSRVTRAEITIEEVDLASLAREVLAELTDSDPHRRVETVIPASLVAQADRHLARVLLDNLLGNAWKFTSRRDAARIELGCLNGGGEGDESAFFVRDNGAGFDMVYAGKLFGAFQRLHSSAEYEGTGIGLATVQRIVHRHGGRAWAEGVVGQGATFFFTLPAPRDGGSRGGDGANNGANGDQKADQRGGSDE